MDWDESITHFVSPAESSLSFPYNYNYSPYPGMQVKHPAWTERQGLILGMEEMKYGKQEKQKKRLTKEQMESLERSFENDQKLDSDRKMKLSREVGLQPRQVAVWFQNRRARWKAKHLENLYDALKHQFDAICKEKQELQEEVMKLKALLREQASRTQVIQKSGEGSRKHVFFPIIPNLREINMSQL